MVDDRIIFTVGIFWYFFLKKKGMLLHLKRSLVSYLRLEEAARGSGPLD